MKPASLSMFDPEDFFFLLCLLRLLAARAGVVKITRVLDRLRCEFDPAKQVQ